jgi:hypothetical protein
MGTSERRKGAGGEQEVRAHLSEQGFEVRALQRSLGDELDSLATGYGWAFAVETKRCESLRLPDWMRRLLQVAPRGYLPLLTYRRSREPWFAVLPLAPLLDHIASMGREHTKLTRELAAAQENVRACRAYITRLEAKSRARSALSDASTPA